MSFAVICPRCNGTGADPEFDGECSACLASGAVENASDVPCRICAGLKAIGYSTCVSCRAKGDDS